ncbi:MAG: phosphoribosylanthranilate isomerase [Gemmatimonadaceae bacterium]|nr:phosphoribosylanthranilate isomerase [Gemmatimonadaceae bacterium]
MASHHSAVALKFCGLTRAEDAVLAAALGAGFLGFIFAPSARQLTVEGAASLLRAVEDTPGSQRLPRPARVGVFAGMSADAIADTVDRLGLDVIQLHGGDDGELVPALRRRTRARIWMVLHVGESGIDGRQLAAAAEGDGVLLDAKVDGMLGGTGRSFDWAATREVVEPLRDGRSIILAGGLRADNVARAIALLAPDVVDVSSGVESAPGVKDPLRMRAFADAVREARDRKPSHE